jgi:hypothetical protein
MYTPVTPSVTVLESVAVETKVPPAVLHAVPVDRLFQLTEASVQLSVSLCTLWVRFCVSSSKCRYKVSVADVRLEPAGMEEMSNWTRDLSSLLVSGFISI